MGCNPTANMAERVRFLPNPPMEKEDLIQPKMLYCRTCDAFSEPDYRLTCEKCGEKLTTCWWALLRRKGDAKEYCTTCKNRFWCWTNTPDGNGRIPTLTQARVANNSYFKNRG